MSRLKILLILFLCSTQLISACSTSETSGISDVQFTRADCISGIYSGENDSTMYIDGYIEVSNPEITSVMIEVDDPTTLSEFWESISQDIPVDASGKAQFSHFISDYEKKHETWNFRLRVVARGFEPTKWKNYEFTCPSEFILDNLDKTK